MTRLLLPALLCAGCLPDFHSLEGGACDSTHGCVFEELLCVAGSCTRKAEAGRNLLSNAGFEEGLAGWDVTGRSRSNTDAGYPHSGQRAALVVHPSTAPPEEPGLTQALSAPFGAGTHLCWDGFVDTGTVTVTRPIELMVKYRVDAADGGPPHYYEYNARSTTDGGVWERVERSFDPGISATVVAFFVRANFQANASFWVDDLRLWLEEDGGCGAGP